MRAVATSQPTATDAGMRALEAGGNAADAALAAAAVLCVTEPMMTGPGGDAFAIVWTPDGRAEGLDASGPAPGGAPADAALAIDHGARAIVVSNHGGRQLDDSIATLDALPGVVNAVAGRAEVLVDGGIRRGIDVLKALALGAHAVLIGRAAAWGLAAAGQAGVERVLEMLRVELSVAMAIAGVTDVTHVDRELLVART